MNFSVDEQGFVTNWLLSGNVCSPYFPPCGLEKTWQDQLGYEKKLRSIFYPKLTQMPTQQLRLGQPGPCGERWRYYYNQKSRFVDTSTFYSMLTSVRCDAATILVCDSPQEVPAVFWTYGGLDVWVNGEKVLDAQPPVYKPIKKYAVSLPLKQGDNLVYVVLHNLGVRDTRNIFGLELKTTENISVALPNEEDCTAAMEAEVWLQGLFCEQGSLKAKSESLAKSVLCCKGKELPLTGRGPWKIPEGVSDFVVKVEDEGQGLSRRFELLERVVPTYLEEKGRHYTQFLQRLAAQKDEPRGNGVHFAAFHVLARLALGESTPEDERLLMNDLDFIESRGDCSDFLVIALIRIVKHYPISHELQLRLKQVLLNFRYWMDEEGEDGMCFWSENHALMFYGSQLVVGQMFPEERFLRSNRTGAEQFEIASKRCRQWLNDVEKEGVEEFNSASYLPVTVAALLNLVDFAPADIAKRAEMLLDTLLRQLCLHVFDGSVISPQGRVYRDVIYPSRQSVQALLHLIDPQLPYSNKENIWCVCFATSRYRFPTDLQKLLKKEAHTSYLSGNARIELQKTSDYILTSVRSPRSIEDTPTWQNLCFVPDADRSTNTYVKSLNERFHGTSVFEPGVYGYQQHLWYAALSNEAVVFVTNPGSDTDFDGMRPGYWYGNGILPAVLQKGNVLGAIYQIHEDYPVDFTHTFYPKCKFDETITENHWIFGRRKEGYLALWCSEKQVACNGALTDCEYRCYSRNAAYFCVCGSAKDSSFEEFQTKCYGYQPNYCKETDTLTAAEFYLHYTFHENKTQFI